MVDPDLLAWTIPPPGVASSETGGILEIDITGTELEHGSFITFNRQDYIASISSRCCLVANCACIRGVSIRLTPISHSDSSKILKERLVNTLQALLRKRQKLTNG